jgi:hypothetical protein
MAEQLVSERRRWPLARWGPETLLVSLKSEKRSAIEAAKLKNEGGENVLQGRTEKDWARAIDYKEQEMRLSLFLFCLP